jgi:tRNA pseudouridine-54 N-methylase
LSSVASVDSAVGIEKHGGPVEVIVELELTEIHVLHLDLANGDESFLREFANAFIATGDIGIEGSTVAAGYAAERDKQRLSGFLCRSHCGGNIVVDPDVRVFAVLVSQTIPKIIRRDGNADRHETQEHQWKTSVGNGSCHYSSFRPPPITPSLMR